MGSSADAVARETAWLRTTGDGLPTLLKDTNGGGGPFDAIGAYIPRTPASEQRSLYVIRRTLRSKRTGSVRNMAQHAFLLQIWWPALDGGGQVENDQQALDVAVDLVFARVGGTVGDKTHGGRFLSVAEDGQDLVANFHDPSTTLASVGALLVDITYSADDVETPG